MPPLSYSNVSDAIAKTNTGVGIDGVHSNHLNFLSVYATRFLTKILNSCILHNYLPRDMLEGYIKPSVKNSMGDITDSNNYREKMISNNMFKLLEYCLLPLATAEIYKCQLLSITIQSSYLHYDGSRYY